MQFGTPILSGDRDFAPFCGEAALFLYPHVQHR